MSRIPSAAEMWRRHATAISSEITVARDLVRRGFEVFRPLALRASCDMIVFKDNRCVRVEVKTVKAHPKRKTYRTIRQLERFSRKADVLAYCTHQFQIRYYTKIPDLARGLDCSVSDFYDDGR